MVILETQSLEEEELANLSMKDDVPTNGINKELPKIGMKFDTEQMAYEYYNRYARDVGFSIRKDFTTHRKDKTISRRVLVRSNQGEYQQHPRGSPLKRLLEHCSRSNL
ncbi:hypothetical protein MKW92_032230 [Papaver armeniacum]|nr:hypothetical protein MKW92_032230 [Papaver armeniacum]